MRFFYLSFIFLCLSISDNVNASSSEDGNPDCVYLHKNILSAAASRGRFYNRLGINSNNVQRLHADRFLNNNYKKYKNRLSEYEKQYNPWYFFLTGMVYSEVSPDMAGTFFNKACIAGNRDPGTLWVLFNEFEKAGKTQWALTCLSMLEKMLLESGASSAEIISQPLLYLHHTNSKTSPGIDYFSNSLRFERLPFNHYIYKLFNPNKFPGSNTSTVLKEITGLTKDSWFIQLGMAFTVFNFFRTVLFVFIIIFYILCFAKFSAAPLHFITHLFPLAIPQSLKISFISILIISAIPVIGIVPFLLITGSFIFFYLKDIYKKLMLFCLILVSLSPFEARITSTFIHLLDNSHPVYCFNKAVSEGPSECLLDKTLQNMNRYPDKSLPYSTAALINLKQNRLINALSHIQKAAVRDPADPVILNLTGIIYSLLGNNEKAAEYYNSCINEFPEYEITYFNLGQLKISMMETNSGGNLVSKATDKNNSLVNRFLNKNHRLFPGSLPALRQFIFPDYKPVYFYLNIIPEFNASWIEADKIWSASFFGIPSFISQIIFIFLIVSVVTADWVISRKKHVKRIYRCPLCGMPMCRLCRTEQGCLDCLKEMTVINDGMIDSGRENKIISHAGKIRKTTSTILNCLMPGCGSIYYSRINAFLFFQLIITSAVYACYARISDFYTSYPYWTIRKPVNIIFIFCAVYSVAFLIYYGIVYLKNTVKKDGLNAD